MLKQSPLKRVLKTTTLVRFYYYTYNMMCDENVLEVCRMYWNTRLTTLLSIFALLTATTFTCVFVLVCLLLWLVQYQTLAEYVFFFFFFNSFAVLWVNKKKKKKSFVIFNHLQFIIMCVSVYFNNVPFQGSYSR